MFSCRASLWDINIYLYTPVNYTVFIGTDLPTLLLLSDLGMFGMFKYLLPPTTMVAAQTAYVAYHRFQQQRLSSIVVNKSNDFRVGATDDLVMDNLQSGDVLLFRRKWYYHYLPMAAAIVAYRQILQTEYDHLAVVLVDDKGKVFLVENTPYLGMQCRPFEDRIEYSEAELISLQLLLPRERTLPTTFHHSAAAHHSAGSLSKLFNTVQYFNEFSRLYLYVWRFLVGKIVGLGKSPLQCPNGEVAIAVFKLIGIQMEASCVGERSEDINIKLIETGAIKLKETTNNSGKLQAVRLSEDNVMIRTR